MDKMIITCAITGAETTREQNPNLPMTPVEIADAAYDACLAGASVLHLHVRDSGGNPTQDIEVFRQVISLIRKKCNMVVEITTGGAVGMTLEERIAPLSLEPEMASLDCGTINFGDEYIVNTMPDLRLTASRMNELKVRPTLEVFDISHMYTAGRLIKEGLLKAPFHYGIVMNFPGGIPYTVGNLSLFTDRLPEQSYWTIIGIGGKASISKLYGAIAIGGNIRVGFEDNIYFTKGTLASGNAELVERATRIARESGREVATPDDVRKQFCLRKE